MVLVSNTDLASTSVYFRTTTAVIETIRITVHGWASSPNLLGSLIKAVVYHNENPIYVFSEEEFCGLGPNVHIHVSVSDLYIPRIGLPIFLQQNRQTNRGNI